jgi:MFS family permease
MPLEPPVPQADRARPLSRDAGLLAAVALAYAGGTISYLPFLTLLLPLKMEALAGATRLPALTAAILCGAVAASLSNILFGWLSDRTVRRGGGRRGWMLAGAGALALSFVAVALARSPAAVVAAVVLFQCAVNLLLAPMMAVIAEEVPDAAKGLAGGLMSLAGPAASALGVALVAGAALGEGARLAVIAGVVALAVLPLAWLPRPAVLPAVPARGEPTRLRRDLVNAWIARLLVQVAGNVLSLYLLYYFESVTPGRDPAETARHVSHVLTIAYLLPLPVAVVLGRVSDRIGRRKPILFGAALLAGAGLVAMAAARDSWDGAIGFSAYAVGSQLFLVLHNVFAMQLLPDPAHRGRDLGVLNLTNTLPALAGTLLTWLLATPDNFAPLLLLLAGLTVLGGATMLAVHGRR